MKARLTFVLIILLATSTLGVGLWAQSAARGKPWPVRDPTTWPVRDPTTPLVAPPAPGTARALPDKTIVLVSQKRTGDFNAFLPLNRTEFYLTGPSVGVPAERVPGGPTPSASRFIVRAWREGQKARILVSAKRADARAPTGETETPIATFILAFGEQVEVAETEPWGAARIVVKLAAPLPR